MSIRVLPNELQQKAEAELNEVPNRIQDDLEHLRNWVRQQRHLNAREDDQWLLNFLRNGKFSLQRTKEKLDAFYTLRSLAPEIFNDRDPFLPEIQDILKRGLISVITNTSKPLLPVVIMVRWKTVKPENVSMSDVIKLMFMIFDILLNENDNIIISGLQLVEDMEGFSMGYLTQLTPAIVKKFVMAIQDVYPIRIQGVHVINVVSYFDTIYNLFKPFLKEKIKRRIKIHGDSNFTDLYQDIPVSVLPKEYGGDGECFDEIAADWKKKIESYRDWFMDDAQYRTDETKRPGKPKTTADVFGVEGSFRKLDID